MSNRPSGLRARAVATVLGCTLAGGVLLLAGVNRLFFDLRPEGASTRLLLNEALVLVAVAILETIALTVVASRVLRPVREIVGQMMDHPAMLTTLGLSARESSLRRVSHSVHDLLDRYMHSQHALEELDRVRADVKRLRIHLDEIDRGARPAFRGESSVLPEIFHEIAERVGEFREYRSENADVSLQVQTEAREAVLAIRDGAALSESVYIEASELAVTLRELARVIQETRPVLEADVSPLSQPGGAQEGLALVCKMLTEVADRYRWFALRISRDWSRSGEAQVGQAIRLVEDLTGHLETAENEREKAENLLTQVPTRPLELRPQVRTALKKLLQSAEIANERLTRLTAAAERASSASRRATRLVERELQSLEALGARLSLETSEGRTSETLGNLTLSWIRTDEQRAIFGEILEETARTLADQPPGATNAVAVLRLASADANLVGLRQLGTSLHALAERATSPAFSESDRIGYAGSLRSLSQALRRGQDIDREVSWQEQRVTPPAVPGMSAAPPVEAPPRPRREPPAAPAPAPRESHAPEAPAPPGEPELTAPEFEVTRAAAPEAAAPAREAAPPLEGEESDLYEPRIYLEVPAAGSLQGAVAEPGADVRGRALVLDPSFVSRSQLVRVLRKLGWEAVEYDLTSHAFEALEATAADLLIADARRLKVTSRDLVAEVARRSPGRPVQVLFLVDSLRPEEEMQLRAEGAAGCIARPVDEGALKTLLDSIVPRGGHA